MLFLVYMQPCYVSNLMQILSQIYTNQMEDWNISLLPNAIMLIFFKAKMPKINWLKQAVWRCHLQSQGNVLDWFYDAHFTQFDTK